MIKDEDKKIGRPTKMTIETVKKLEEAFALDCSDIEATFYAGISKPTLYKYQDKNSEFLDRKEQLKSNPILKARKTIVNSLDDPRYAFKYLERKVKDEFGTNNSNDPIQQKSIVFTEDGKQCSIHNGIKYVVDIPDNGRD